MKPVGVSTFLGDDKVQDIINEGKGGVIVDPGYENPEDLAPVLVLVGLTGNTPLLAEAMVPVPTMSSVTIAIDNVSVYTDTGGAIKWFFDGALLTETEGVSGENGEIVTITNNGIAPFVEGTYQLAAVGYTGTENDVPYSTEVFIVIEE
jgi:hypothetical protein